MNLPDVLEALAVRLPDRFSLAEGRAGGTVKLLGRDDEADEWINLGWWPKTGGGYAVRDRDLRALLEEEIEARNWAWHTHHTGPREYRSHCVQIYPSQSALSGTFQSYADTPALALALAVLAALEEEEHA